MKMPNPIITRSRSNNMYFNAFMFSGFVSSSQIYKNPFMKVVFR